MLNTMGYNHFFCFRPEVIPYLGKLGYKNGPFKLKFGTQTNLNLQKSMVMFTLSFLDRTYPFKSIA